MGQVDLFNESSAGLAQPDSSSSSSKAEGAGPVPGAASRARVSGETCGTCGHAGKGKHGFLPCEFLPHWTRISEVSLCDFSPSRWIPVDASKLARRDAQTGIDQAVAAADRAVQGWSELAFDFVRLYATQRRGQRFIGHDIVKASEARGLIQPPNPKAWGAPIQRAAREGIIKRVGHAPDPNRHTNPVPLWEAA